MGPVMRRGSIRPWRALGFSGPVPTLSVGSDAVTAACLRVVEDKPELAAACERESSAELEEKLQARQRADELLEQTPPALSGKDDLVV